VTGHLASGAAAILAVGLAPGLCAQAETPPDQQEVVIVYVHAVATRVSVVLDGLTIHRTESVFGVWNYQFNLSSWLDTEPHTLAVEARLGNKDSAYCSIEVRAGPSGDPATARMLAEKTLRGSDTEHWNRANTVVSLEIARPPRSIRPLWVEREGANLQGVSQSRSAALVKELFDSLRQCDLETLLGLIGPALANQAAMEGAEPELVRQTTLARLQRDCIPGIAVAESRQAFLGASYQTLMAPLDFDDMTYRFIRDESREDGRGNLFTPTEPIRFKNAANQEYVVRPFLSYTDDRRSRRFVSRFLFERAQ
jgi:hypothetical protein